MYDILIQKARVYDGGGKPAYLADVAVSGGKIVEIERAETGRAIPENAAAKTISAEGLCLSSGFIDVHSHSDDTLLICPTADSKLHQGVTTDVFGNCGFSVFPITDKNLWNLRKEFEPLGVEPDWKDLAGYRKRLDCLGLSLNVMTLIGHGTLRSAILGFDNRIPSGDELKAMANEIEKAMDQGASGLSSGLQYPPGLYAGKDEIHALARAAQGKGGIYTSHMRSEGDQLIESIEETLDTGAKTGIPVIISHLKATDHQNWGRTGLAITLVEIARHKGMEVAFDRYPYLATSTSLDIFMPPWAHDGGREKLLQRLKSGDRKLFDEFRASVEHRSGWDAILISDTPSPDAPNVLGKTVTEIARERGGEPWKTAIDLLIEGECRVGMCNFSMCQEDTDRVLAHPYCMIGSDASAVCPEGVLGRRKPHPRAYGTFPRFLGEYARDRQLVPVEDAIRRITALPAQALGLKKRGKVEKEYWADLVLFRLEQIEDRARFGDPHHFPSGIEAVVVNGQLALEKGTITDARPGKFLSREG